MQLRAANNKAIWAQYKHIVFDVSKARRGLGDIAAAVTMARSLRNQGYNGQITFASSEKSLQRLEMLIGPSISKYEINNTQTMQPIKSADLYFELAGKIKSNRPDQSAVASFRSSIKNVVKNWKTIDMVYMPVFSNEEDLYGDGIFAGLLNLSGTTFRLSAPGLGLSENGVNQDPFVEALRNMNEVDRYNTLIEQLDIIDEHHPIQDARQFLTKKNIRVTTGYGHHFDSETPRRIKQFQSYFTALRNPDTATVVFIPGSTKDSSYFTNLPEGVKILDNTSPKSLKKQYVYVAPTERLPQNLFNALLANSTAPPLVFGDGAVSAATRLGLVFGVGTVPWNLNSINHLKQRLMNFTSSSNLQNLVSAIYNSANPSYESVEKLWNSDYKALVSSELKNVPLLFKQLEDIFTLSKSWVDGKMNYKQAMQSSDDIFRTDLLLKMAKDGDQKALAQVRKYFEKRPKTLLESLARGMVPFGIIDDLITQSLSKKQAVKKIGVPTILSGLEITYRERSSSYILGMSEETLETYVKISRKTRPSFRTYERFFSTGHPLFTTILVRSNYIAKSYAELNSNMRLKSGIDMAFRYGGETVKNMIFRDANNRNSPFYKEAQTIVEQYSTEFRSYSANACSKALSI